MKIPSSGMHKNLAALLISVIKTIRIWRSQTQSFVLIINTQSHKQANAPHVTQRRLNKIHNNTVNQLSNLVNVTNYQQQQYNTYKLTSTTCVHNRIAKIQTKLDAKSNTCGHKIINQDFTPSLKRIQISITQQYVIIYAPPTEHPHSTNKSQQYSILQSDFNNVNMPSPTKRGTPPHTTLYKDLAFHAISPHSKSIMTITKQTQANRLSSLHNIRPPTTKTRTHQSTQTKSLTKSAINHSTSAHVNLQSNMSIPVAVILMRFNHCNICVPCEIGNQQTQNLPIKQRLRVSMKQPLLYNINKLHHKSNVIPHTNSSNTSSAMIKLVRGTSTPQHNTRATIPILVRIQQTQPQPASEQQALTEHQQTIKHKPTQKALPTSLTPQAFNYKNPSLNSRNSLTICGYITLQNSIKPTTIISNITLILHIQIQRALIPTTVSNRLEPKTCNITILSRNHAVNSLQISNPKAKSKLILYKTNPPRAIQTHSHYASSANIIIPTPRSASRKAAPTNSSYFHSNLTVQIPPSYVRHARKLINIATA
eukprot:gene3343-2325_t